VTALLAFASICILIAFSTALIAVLDHFGVLEDRRPRIKRTP
jgi:hypothetical protein